MNEEYENIQGLGIKPITKEKAVQLYKNMRTRCYNPSFHKTRPSYAVCTICDEWLEDRTKFYEWVYDNYYTVGSEQMQLDKDILVKGNKIYSPSTCIFVPRSINSLFENSAAIRGDCPVGISYDKNLKKYRGYLSVNGRNIKLHSWNTPEEAFAESMSFI